MKLASQIFGKQGEMAVQNYLVEKGFSIIACNYRKFFGEIDIIAQKKDLIVFVEVKMRSKNTIDATELVNRTKQKKIGLVAQTFIASQALENVTYQFDVALVGIENNNFEIRYIENAFTLVE